MASKSITCVWGTIHAAETLEVTRGETLQVTIRVEDPPVVAGQPNTPRNCAGSTLSIAWECARGRTGSPRRLDVPGAANGVHTLAIPATDTWYFPDAPYAWDAWITREGVATPLVARGEIIGRYGVGPGASVVSDASNVTRRSYFGSGSSGITDPAVIEAMTHVDGATKSFVATVSPTVQKVYIAHPAAHGTPIIRLNGFALDELPARSIILHDTDGQLIVYTLHESTYALTGSNLQFEVLF